MKPKMINGEYWTKNGDFIWDTKFIRIMELKDFLWMTIASLSICVSFFGIQKIN